MSYALAQSVTADASRVDQLNMLNIVDRNEFISLIRENFGATSMYPSCGLKRDREAHGKHQDTMRCIGCKNFKLRINLNKDGCWRIVKSSGVEHGTDDLTFNVATPCEVGNAQSNKRVVTATGQTKETVGKRIHAKTSGCSSEKLRRNLVIKAVRLATQTGKRKLSAHQTSSLATALNLPKPTVDQIKKSAPNKLTEDEVKEEFSLEAYAKALLKANPGMRYEFKTHENGTLKHLIIVVSGAAHIFQSSQQIIYIDCAHMKANDSNIDFKNDGYEFVLPVLIAITCKTFNKNNHVLVYGVGDGENSVLISACIALAKEAGLDMNSKDVVIMSDRGSAIIKSVSNATPLANHVYCAVHLKRNLEEMKIPTFFMHLFWNARNARTAYLHAAAMKEMETKCPRMHKYLASIPNWAIHELVAKGIPLYELQSSNSVEQVFALPAIIEGRKQLPTSLMNVVLEWHLHSLMTQYNHILKEDSKQLQPLLTPAGQAHLGTMGQEFLNNSYTSYNVLLTHPMDKTFAVTTQGGFLKAEVSHAVDLLEGKCSCTLMQQVRLPCVHVFAVVRHCYGLQWVSNIPWEEMKSIIGEEWLYKNWVKLYQEPTIYGKMPTIEGLHAEMDSSVTSYPRTRRTKEAGSNAKGSFRFTSTSEAGKKRQSFGNRRVNAPCLTCGKMMTVPNSDAKKIANGTYIKVHEPSACEKYASKNPSTKESIQAELKILRENFLGISDGANVGGCILGSNVEHT